MVQFYKIAPFNWTGIQQGNILDNTNNTGGNTKMTSSNQKIEKYNNLIAEIKKSNNSKNIDGDNNIYKEFDDIEDNNMIHEYENMINMIKEDDNMIKEDDDIEDNNLINIIKEDNKDNNMINMIKEYENMINMIKEDNNMIKEDDNIYKEFDDIEDNNMIKIKSQKIVEKKRKPKIHFKKLECIKDCITNIIIILKSLNLLIKSMFFLVRDFYYKTNKRFIEFNKEKLNNSIVYESNSYGFGDGFSYTWFIDITDDLFLHSPFILSLFDIIKKQKEKKNAEIKEISFLKVQELMQEHRARRLNFAKKEKRQINIFARFLKFFYGIFIEAPNGLGQRKPLKKPPKMKDRIQKIVRDYGFKRLSRAQQADYCKALMKKEWDRSLKRAREILAARGGGDDDDDDKFLKFLNSILDRFEDVTSHIIKNKKLYLLFTGLIGASVYLYKNRKAVKKSLNEAMQEIEKKCASFEKLINKYK